MHLFSLLSLLPVISAYLVSGSPTSASTLLPVDDTFSAYHCTDSQTWSGPSFFPRDCATALARFCVSELQVHEDVVFEFLAVGGRAQSGYASQETPRKYTYGTCTMAIAMLVAFFPEELPGVSPSRVFGLMDVATYNDVWNAVRRVMDNCISKYLATNETVLESEGGLNFRSQTGWSALGSKGDIGVFLWDTSSSMNQRINAVNLAADVLGSSHAPLRLLNSTYLETA